VGTFWVRTSSIDLRHCRKRLDYFVSLLLGMQSWTGWHTYRDVLFYLKAATRIHEKLACTQVNCSWILPTYANEVPYARAKDIDLLSAKKIWSKKILTRELRIYNSRKPQAIQQLQAQGLHRPTETDA